VLSAHAQVVVTDRDMNELTATKWLAKHPRPGAHVRVRGRGGSAGECTGAALCHINTDQIQHGMPMPLMHAYMYMPSYFVCGRRGRACGRERVRSRSERACGGSVG